jgi:hypothetical protein
MKREKKRASELTTAEAMKRLFPPQVAAQVRAEAQKAQPKVAKSPKHKGKSA